ncbi:hypothetical protein [Nostoc sp. MG11]|uniref:hypothetical protein n=1 Tax=Nostoc sp. MG11 TaxID=2721166 RepID=UPI001865C8D7|nr:hypothetical protein [Nostoc sp. MG11]
MAVSDKERRCFILKVRLTYGLLGVDPQKARDRLTLERKVERAFFVAGKALMELRDRRTWGS